MKKKMLIAVLIGVFSLSVGCSGVSEGIKQGYEDAMNEETVEEEKVEEKTEEVKEEVKEETSVEGVKEDIPESNTTEMINYITKKADADIESSDDLNKLLDEALVYIKDNYNKDIFSNNETMEKFMYYGRILEKGYQESAGTDEKAKTLRDIGTDSIQLVKYVYRGHEKPEDDATKSNIEQIEKGLNKLK